MATHRDILRGEVAGVIRSFVEQAARLHLARITCKRVACSTIGLFFLLLFGCAREKTAPYWVGHLAPIHEDTTGAMDLLMKMRYYASTTIAGRSVSVLHVEANKSEARAEASRLLMVNQVSALIVGPGVDKVEDVIALARTRESPIIILDELADEAQAGPAILLGPSPTTRGKTLAEYGLTIGKNARVEVDTNDRIACSVASAFTTAWREGGGAIVESDANVHLLAIPLERFQAGLQAAPLDVQPPILYGGPDGTLNVPPGYTIVEATARSELAERSEEAIAWEQAYRKRFQQAPSRRACLAYEGLSAVLKGLEKTQGSPYGKLRDQITKEATRTLFLVRHAQGKRSLLKTIPAPEQ